ncbi:MAG: hypothetical protein AB7O49_05785 [Sphingomonadales bacterium]
MGRIEPELGWGGFVAVRLLRSWAAAREAEKNPLPIMVELGNSMRLSPQVAVALASLFQLTEGCLGRRLRTECCCSRSVSPDERAVLTMIVATPTPELPSAPRHIPHGLPGALAWAAFSVRRLLGHDFCQTLLAAPDRCPFERV